VAARAEKRSPVFTDERSRQVSTASDDE
jgi:hypothetical protein